MTLPEFLALSPAMAAQAAMEWYMALGPETQPQWGNMTAQQVVEHLSLSLKAATLGVPAEVTDPPAKTHLYTDDELPRHIRGLEARPHYYEDIAQSKDALADALARFFAHPAEGPWSGHPRMGAMTAQDWHRLQRKHLYHHARQFGLV